MCRYPRPCECAKDYDPDMRDVWREVLREEAKAYCRARLRLAKKTDDWDALPVSAEMRGRMDQLRQMENMFAQEAKERNDGKSTDRWFVTFNPPHDTDPNVLWTAVTGYLRKNCGKSIAAYHCVIEQRSEDPETPKGWHVHVCVQYSDDLARSVLYQRLKATASRFWSDDQMKKPEYKKNWLTCIHLQDYHRKYVDGEKREEKMGKVRADVEVRRKYGFPEFASSPEKIFPSEDIENGISPLPPQTSSDASAPPG